MSDPTIEDLNSGFTFVYQFVLPPCCLFVFAAGTVAAFDAPRGSLDPWFFSIGVLVLAVPTFWFGARLRLVSLDGDTLVISNRRKTIRVLLRDVERASSTLFWNPQVIRLQLRVTTDLGSRISFLPKQRFLGGYSRHPLAARLNALIADARG